MYCFVCPGLILQNVNQVEIKYSYAMTADSDFLFDMSLPCPAYVIRYALVSGLICMTFYMLMSSWYMHDYSATAVIFCMHLSWHRHICTRPKMYIYTLTAIKYNSYH